jgi:hypothetical protein
LRFLPAVRYEINFIIEKGVVTQTFIVEFAVAQWIMVA